MRSGVLFKAIFAFQLLDRLWSVLAFALRQEGRGFDGLELTQSAFQLFQSQIPCHGAGFEPLSASFVPDDKTPSSLFQLHAILGKSLVEILPVFCLFYLDSCGLFSGKAFKGLLPTVGLRHSGDLAETSVHPLSTSLVWSQSELLFQFPA